MARTFINPLTQIGNSTEYKDDLAPSADLQNNAESLQDDLNALRSMLKSAVGKAKWYNAPTADLESVNTAVGTAQSDITALQGDVSALESDVSTLQTDLSTAQGNISTLQTDLDAAEQNISTLQTDLDAAESNISTLQTGLSTAEGNITSLDSRLTTAEGEIDTLQTGLGTAEQNISTLQTGLTTAEGNITSLDGRLTTAEGEIDTLQSDLLTAQGNISTLQSDVSTAQGDISTLQSTVATHGTDISTLQGQVTTLEGTSTSQGSAISTLQGDVSTLQSNVSTLQGDVSTLQSGLSTAQGDISTLQSGLSTAQGDISTLQSDLSTLSGNAILKDGSVAFTSDQSMGSHLLTDLASPSSANDAATKGYVDAVAMGLKIKAPVEAKYDFAGGLAPDVPTLPSEPSLITYPGTEYTVTTEAEFDAALAAATDGDRIWVPKNTTITLTSSKTINKSIMIYGKADNSSVFTASFAVAANSGLFIVAGKKASGAQNNNVRFYGLAITSSSNQNDHACIVANTLSAEFPNGSTGLRIETCTFNHTEFGVTIAADSWVVKNCTFNYIPESGASDTHRHMGIYNIGTMGWIESCDFKATTEATPRTIAMLLSASDYIFTPGATASGGFSGNLVVKGCTQSSGNMRQWFVQEVFKANGLNSAPMAEHGFSLWFSNNTVGQTSGGTINVYEGGGSKAPLNFYDTVYLRSNSFGDSSGTKKGAIAVDGLGTKRSAGAPMNIYAEYNGGTAFTTALSGTYVQGSDSTNMVAVNSTYFNTPSPLLAVVAPTTGQPLAPSGTGVDVGQYVAQAGDRIFVVNAFDTSKSGIYVCAAGDWAYADDWTGDVASSFFFVKQGSYADTSWVEVSDPALVGQNFMSFAQFSGPGTYTGTGAISVSAQNVISVSTGGITNAMLAGSIELSKLADTVYAASTVDDLLSDKLDLAGGTMSANSSIVFASDSGAITGLADLGPNSLNSAAANKKYVDDAVSNLDARTSKTYSVVTAQNGVPAGYDLYKGVNGGGNLSDALPAMPEDGAVLSSKFDIYLNGQLLRVGNLMDVNRSANNPNALVLEFPAAFGDTLCVVEYA